MASALEKFVEAMNKVSPFWTKNSEHNLEIIAKHGKIVCVKCDGFSFMSDDKREPINQCIL